MRGQIKPDHIPVNKFQLLVIGLPPLTVVKASGIEEEIQKVMLPDRTAASGGNTEPVEFTIEIPMHHGIERAAMEIWFRQGQDPVTPVYKLAGTLLMTPISGAAPASYTLIGLWVSGRKLPDLDMNNEGEMAVIEYTLSADKVLPV